MLHKALFLFTFLLFCISFLWEKRRFRNALYLGLCIFFGCMVISDLLMIAGARVWAWLFGLFFIPLCILIMSAIFIAAGILSVRREGCRLSHLLSIGFGVAIWAEFGLVIFILFGQGYAKVALVGILFSVLGVFILFTFMSLFLYTLLCKIMPKRKKCDFIIIHGAGLLGGERVSPLLAERLQKGIQVYEHTDKQAKIIVSGGQGADERISEAEAMYFYLLEKGIDPADILMEEKSTTTYENLRYAKEIMDSRKQNYRCIFVTNDYHVFRTGLYAKRLKIKAEGVGCKTAFYYWPNAFVREYIGVMVHFKVPVLLFVVAWFVAFAVLVGRFLFV